MDLIGIVYWTSSSRLRPFVTKTKDQSNSKDSPVSEIKMAYPTDMLRIINLGHAKPTSFRPG